MSLERKIEKRMMEWVAAGLISPDQAQAIRRHEEAQSSSGLLFWLAWLAGSCIVLGIIALIAANWSSISGTLKLVIYFLVYSAAAYALLKHLREKPIAAEILRLCLMGYTMAGIGLVSQVYHLHSDPYRGIFFWCALTFGFVLLCRTALGAGLWIPTFFLGVGLLLADQKLSSVHNTMVGVAFVGLMGTLGTLPRRFPSLVHFQNASFSLSTFATLLFTMTGLYTFRKTGLLVPEVMMTFFATFLIWASAAYFTNNAPRSARLGLCGFLFCALFQTILFMTAVSETGSDVALKAVSILLFAIGTLSLAIAAFAYGQRRLFEGLVILVFLRYLFAYAEYLMTALMGGFGLITFGIFMFGAIYVWQKYRGRIIQQLEKQFHDKG